jgi:hypothetical protein
MKDKPYLAWPASCTSPRHSLSRRPHGPIRAIVHNSHGPRRNASSTWDARSTTSNGSATAFTCIWAFATTILPTRHDQWARRGRFQAWMDAGTPATPAMDCRPVHDPADPAAPGPWLAPKQRRAIFDDRLVSLPRPRLACTPNRPRSGRRLAGLPTRRRDLPRPQGVWGSENGAKLGPVGCAAELGW